jgi:hypothetical protein
MFDKDNSICKACHFYSKYIKSYQDKTIVYECWNNGRMEYSYWCLNKRTKRRQHDKK